jgi:hypothetical protein
MITHRIDQHAAFVLLRSASSSNNRKLRDIASAVVEQMRTGAPGDDPLVAALLTPATAQ